MKLMPRKVMPDSEGLYMVLSNLESTRLLRPVYNKGLLGIASFQNGEWRILPENILIDESHEFFWIQLNEQPERLSEKTSKEDAIV